MNDNNIRKQEAAIDIVAFCDLNVKIMLVNPPKFHYNRI